MTNEDTKQESKRGSGDEEKNTLVQDFQEYFSVDLALTEEQKKKVFEIRYRVYCDEFKYEEEGAFPEHAEHDEFDAFSLHCLITHKSSQFPAACVRLVEVDEQDKIMPMEKFCAEAIDRDFVAQLGAERSTVCEFSRLAVDGSFRRRLGEEASPLGAVEEISEKEQRTFTLIAVATFMAGFAAANLIGRTNVFAMMEPFLPTLLLRSGIDVQKAGEDVDYHGMRAPYFITSQTAVKQMNEDLRDLYADIYRRIKKQL